MASNIKAEEDAVVEQCPKCGVATGIYWLFSICPECAIRKEEAHA